MTEATRELRLALGMRGGVSLAVWIGGACAEIDELRRSDRDGADPFWHGVREASGWDRVVVDVLAGASAGGLNGVLYAAGLAYDFELARVRDLWLDAADVATLLRTEPPYVSLFQGDEVFLARVHQGLHDLVTGPHESTRPDGEERERIVLRLSATLLEAVERLAASPDDEEQWDARAAGGFEFRQPAEAWLPSDFPDRDDRDELDRALWRLAVAARSTSSFPVAFEGALVRSGRRDSFTARPRGGPAGAAVDLDGTFVDRTQRGDRSFVVGDGGILDNIPLGRAISAIASAPAGGPTRRVLVYLQPGQPTMRPLRPHDDLPVDEAGGRRRRGVPAVGRGIGRAIHSDETIAQDVAELDRHSQSVDRARAVRAATFTPIVEGTTAPTARERFTLAAAAARPAYGEQRGAEDARLVVGLLDNPIRELGRDPFPRQVAGVPVSDDAWRAPMGRLSQAQRRLLSGALWTTFLARAHAVDEPEDVVRLGSGPLIRITRLLLEWAWYLESRGVAVGPCKRELYRVLAFAEEVVERPRRLAWVAATARRMTPLPGEHRPTFDDPEAFVASCARWFDRLYVVEQAPVLHAALASGDAVALARARADVVGRIDDVVAGALGGVDVEPVGPEADLRSAVLLPRLLGVAAALQRERPADVVPDAWHPGVHLDAVLGGSPVVARTLADLETLCFAEFLAGTPCQSPIEFRRMSAANRVPIAPEFTALLDAAAGRAAWWDAEQPPPAPQRGIHVDLKLAGNELSNFAAFLLPEWRANDWLWGRMDAVPTLVDILLAPGPFKSYVERTTAAASTPPDPVDAVRALAVPSGGGPVAEAMAAEFDRRRVEIAAELDVLLTSDTPDGVELPTIRDIVIARRQWEVLVEELPLRRDVSGDARRDGSDPLLPGPTADLGVVRAAVAAYDVGAQTTGKPQGIAGARDRATVLRGRFRALVDTGSEVVLTNATQDLGGPVAPSTLRASRRRWVGRVLRIVGRLAVRGMLPRAGHGGPVRVLGATAVCAVALVAAVVVGIAIALDPTAYVLGVATVVMTGIALAGAVVVLGRPRTPPPSAGRAPVLIGRIVAVGALVLVVVAAAGGFPG
jgi:patatin-related protein